jgi:hypothetical protein
MATRERGVTLVELLVGLAVQAFVLAGTVILLQAALAALARVQASLRRGLAVLSDDLQEIGFRVPLGDPPPGWPGLRLEKAEGGDKLSFLKDEVLPGEARLGADCDGEGRVTLVASRRIRLQPGDLLCIEDARWEAVRVRREQLLEPGRQATVSVESPEGAEVRAPQEPHGAGVPLSLVRPNRRVRYALVPETGGANLLVRQETSGAFGGPGAGRQGASERVLAAGLASFRVDLPRGAGAGFPPLVRVVLESGNREAKGPLARPPRQVTLVRAPRNGPGATP